MFCICDWWFVLEKECWKGRRGEAVSRIMQMEKRKTYDDSDGDVVAVLPAALTADECRAWIERCACGGRTGGA